MQVCVNSTAACVSVYMSLWVSVSGVGGSDDGRHVTPPPPLPPPLLGAGLEVRANLVLVRHPDGPALRVHRLTLRTSTTHSCVNNVRHGRRADTQWPWDRQQIWLKNCLKNYESFNRRLNNFSAKTTTLTCYHYNVMSSLTNDDVRSEVTNCADIHV